MVNFEGKVALVTGGGSGIGRATALAFAKEGAKVVVAGRRAEAGEETVRLIKQAGGEATFIQADLTDEAQTKSLIEQVVAIYGRLDVAFNNAGYEGQVGPLTETTEQEWQATIDNNLKSAWLSLKYEIPQMIRQGGGSIINNASVAAHIGFSNAAAYAAAKHGVLGLTRTAALENAPQRVRVNAVSPGGVETTMPARMFGSIDTFKQFVGGNTPLGRIAQPEEIAQTVLWLASDAASYITGHALLADGGLTAQ